MDSMSGIVQLLEFVTSDRTLTVVEDQCVIKNVRALGLTSANKRRYDREAVRKAMCLYEGKAVNANHPSLRNAEQRSVYDRIGWLENVRQDSDGGLRADLHYLKAHALAGPLVEAARRRPELFGLSHNARGRARTVAGVETVEEILSVE